MSASRGIVKKTLKNILKTNNFANVLEIGTASGITTKKILSLLENRGRLYCCDPFIDYPDKQNRNNEDAYHKFLNNIKDVSSEENFYFKRDKSENFLDELYSLGLKKTFDLIFIDGDHSTDAVISDFKYADLLIKDGGIIVFDDYHWIARHRRKIANIKPPVKVAVEKILTKSKDYDVLKISTHDCFVIQKRRT
tara:strand:+ start:5245 stop:5826 length:582 start_codon:yes stop_codon:yes gene_type:complete